MTIRFPLAVATLFLAVAIPLITQAQDGPALAPAVPTPRTIAYGRDRMQTLDYWTPSALPMKERPPLIVFVHGGAWSMGNKNNGTGRWKEAHFTAQGYAFASLDYRLVPGVRVEDEGDDIARALRMLIDKADELGFDPRRIALMGHSAGAQLVALVSTDPDYLSRAGLSFANIAGTIAIDGAGYDVPKQISTGNAFMHRQYMQAFGSDVARQRALSPTFQASPPNVDRFLLLHVQRPDGIAQTDELAAALSHSGAKVQENGFAGFGLMGHLTINRRLGDPSYPATPVVDQWLAGLFHR